VDEPEEHAEVEDDEVQEGTGDPKSENEAMLQFNLFEAPRSPAEISDPEGNSEAESTRAYWTSCSPIPASTNKARITKTS
jgi:hypothetical protein